MNQFESAFDKFLDEDIHEDTNDAIFRLTRRAFMSGWLAAGGDEPIAGDIIHLKDYLRGRPD